MTGDASSTTLSARLAARLRRIANPRATVAYRRTRVGSEATGHEIDALDRPRLEEEAERLGYESADEGEWEPIGSGNWQSSDAETWVRNRWLFGAVVRWERTVEEETRLDGSTDRQWVLSETLELPVAWLWALVTASVLALCWIYLPVGRLVWVGIVGTYCLFSAAFAIHPSPLDSYLDRLQDPDTADKTALSPQDYKTSCVGPSLTALLVGVLSCGPLFVAGFPLLIGEIQAATTVDFADVSNWIDVLLVGGLWMAAFCLIALGVGLLIYLYEDDAVRIRVFPFDLLARSALPTPELSGGYLTLVLVALAPVFALTHSSFLLPVVNRLTTTEMVVYFLTPPALLMGSLLWFLYWWVIRNRQYVYERTIERLHRHATVPKKIGTMAVLAAASYTLCFTVIAFVRKFQAYLVWPILNRNSLPVLDTPVLVGVLVVALLPALYFCLGLTYQLVGFLKLLWKTYVVATPIDRTPRVDASLRILETDAIEAYALGFGPLRTVVVSRGAEAALEDEQFDAIVAHEEAHLDPAANEYWLSDGAVGMLAPILGTVTLTGKNVVYALLDFRDREQAADRYAAAQTSPEALALGLERLDEVTDARAAPAAASFVPSASPAALAPAARPDSLSGVLERYFGLVFGSFALVRAHPSVSERIAALDEDAAVARDVANL